MIYSGFDGRLALLQRVLPSYRKEFFEALAARIHMGMTLLAGQPRREEAIQQAGNLEGIQLTMTRNIHFSKGKSFLCWQKGVNRWLAGSDPDILIAEANPRYLSTWAAIRWMHARRRPVIGWGLGAPGAGSQSGLRARFIRQFDALITYSQAGAGQYARLGFPADRIHVAPNAVTLRPGDVLPDRQSRERQRASLLFVGRLQDRKRVDNLILACAKLSPALQPRLVIVGDGPARQNLEELARNTYPQTVFSGGVHGMDLEPYFEAADLFVLPGTGGLAIQQAMAHGLPVIAGVADGTQADLVRALNGWQLPDEGVDSLTAILVEALQDRDRLLRMGRESYRIIREEINVDHMVEVFLAAIEQASHL